jgi:hypothetical protein
MQELPENVGRMVESMYEQLMDRHAAAAADLLSNATNNKDGSMAAEARQRFKKELFGLSFPFADNHVSLRQEETQFS